MYKFIYIDGHIYGDVGVLCDKCGHIDIHKINYDDNNIGRVEKCSKCNNEIKIENANKIDPNIAPYIEAFNKMGCKTLYSCEGHPVVICYTTFVNNAYIFFDDCKKMSELFKQYDLADRIDRTWYLDGSDLLDGKFILRSWDNTSLEERLRDLYFLVHVLRSILKEENKDVDE